MDWEKTPVSALYGIGSTRAAAYERMGIRTVSQLLEHYPRAYENRGDVHPLTEANAEGKTAFVLTVATPPKLVTVKRGMTLLKFRAFDDSASCEVTFFNQNYLKESFAVGATYRFFGKLERVRSLYTLANPAFEEAPDGNPDGLRPLVPVYPATEGLSQKQISTHIALALRLAGGDIKDFLPEETRLSRSLCTRGYALRQIHTPESFSALADAKRRLIYDEFFLFALGLALTRNSTKKGTAPRCDRSDLTPFTKILPYPLTGDQSRTVEEIRADMAKAEPMSRMVVGDVGCGKTVCAAAAMLFAVQSGYQAVLMAPTEILARQHAADLGALFGKLHIRVALLIGATPAAEKRRIRTALADENPDTRLQMVIGTQALLSDGVEFAAPGLVVTDEQHRFGVAQRATLSEKSRLCHLLVMSATPIPRSLALGLYGDLDISRIIEMPPGRQSVDTFLVDESYHSRLVDFMEKQITAGGQVYVVCPAIEENEDGQDEDGTELLPLSDIPLTVSAAESMPMREKAPLVSAIAYAARLAGELPDRQVECLHGKMKPAEKDAVMSRFVAGETDILVSTTVIEVGVNVPNACLMLIENADRFGLAQLHQLRGRVGRGTRKSYCVLVKSSPHCGQVAEERLGVMCREHDGYEIARQDLLSRGPGDFLRAGSEGDAAGSGIRQSGSLRLRLAEQCTDGELMETAFADARALLEGGTPEKDSPLLRKVEQLFTIGQSILN